jgi:hypothetical protein
MTYKLAYCKHFGYVWGEFMPSEISGAAAVDIHHIQPLQRGGTDKLNDVTNLIALTRKEHEDYGGLKQFKSTLYRIHLARLRIIGKDFDESWMEEQIRRYEPYENETK